MKVLNFLANIIWIILGGLASALAWCFVGLILCITIVGIPLGKQCFKFAGVYFAPFGKKVKLNFSMLPYHQGKTSAPAEGILKFPL